MLFAPKENGQGLIEYAIILSLVAVVVIVVVWAFGPRLGQTYSTINSSLP
jgi:pilus assembly protein Flp/PilA